MQRTKFLTGLGVFYLFFSMTGAPAQELIRGKTKINDLRLLSYAGGSNVNLSISQSLQYAVTGSFTTFFNWKKTGEVNNLFLLQDLKYNSLFDDNGIVKISNSFTHNLGVQFIPDSITILKADDNIITTRVEVALSKRCAYNLLSVISTRLFNDYTIMVDDSGTRQRILNSGFFTPLLWTFSTGITLLLPQAGKVAFGVAGGKITYILNRQVYRDQDVDIFFGVPESKRYNFEYGLSFQLLIDKDLFSRVHWNCDLLLFKNYQKPVDLTLRNNFTVKISKFLQASVQTRILYEEAVCKSLQIENVVSLGFYFHL